MTDLVIGNVEVEGRPGLGVRVEAGRIVEVGPHLEGAPDLDGRGGALLPGLHDHHIHVLALAARDRSTSCRPRDVQNRAELTQALRRAPGEGWIRGTGWDDVTAGWLDADDLDEMVPDRPVRLQHRGGHLWVLNHAGMAALGLEDAPTGAVERDATGRPTGRLYEADEWLAGRIPTEPPDVSGVGERLASWGITGITDASPANGPATSATFAPLRQHVTLLGGPDLPGGARKLMVTERALPAPSDLAEVIREAHAAGRPAAIHAASREALVVALAALEEAGSHAGDRIEHASVAPPELIEWLARLGTTVVTQPGFVAAHGQRYLETVAPDDRPWLYRGRAFLDAGVPLAAGSDAPFGPADPWIGMDAAVRRQADDGRLVGGAEALSPEQALALYTGPAEQPGGPPRRVAAGEPADLCLLDVPWTEARCRLSSDMVRATVISGETVWSGE